MLVQRDGWERTAGVSWSALDVQVWHLAGWALLLSDLLWEGEEEEKSHVCSTLAASGIDEPSGGNSVRIAAPPAHVREAGWGACGFKHVAEEWMVCCSALPLPLLCFSSKSKDCLAISHDRSTCTIASWFPIHKFLRIFWWRNSSVAHTDLWGYLGPLGPFLEKTPQNLPSRKLMGSA